MSNLGYPSSAPRSAPTSPLPTLTRSTDWQQVPLSYSSTSPTSLGLSLPLRDTSKSPNYSKTSTPYSTRSPSPSRSPMSVQFETQIPPRPVSPAYRTVSEFNRSLSPPPPPPRFSSYLVSPPQPPPPPSPPPPPPVRSYSYVPSYVPTISTSRSPTIKSVSERLIELEKESEETAHTIAHLPDSHKISEEGNMLANDLDRSVSRSESFIKEVEEKLEGLGHKVELPKTQDSLDVPSSKATYSAYSSKINDGPSSTVTVQGDKDTNEKEYVGWRKRMGSVYEVEIKDEKQLLEAVEKSREKDSKLKLNEEFESKIKNENLTENEITQLRKRRESNKLIQNEPESGKISSSSSDKLFATTELSANSCFEVSSAYEERKKQESKKQKVSTS